MIKVVADMRSASVIIECVALLCGCMLECGMSESGSGGGRLECLDSVSMN